METISAVGKIRKGFRQAQRCAGGSEQFSKVSSLGASADSFLRQPFLPLFTIGADFPNKKTAENSFFESLTILQKTHNIRIHSKTAKPYPYNILLAHHLAQKELAGSGKEIELAIIQKDNGRVALSAKTAYNTGNTLYYIPVLPLYRLLQDRGQKQSAEILLSVFAYLYHIAGIPYYRDDYSALAYYYECIEEWFLEECETQDEEESKDIKQELRRASYFGDVMLRKIYNPYNLNYFKQRIQAFFPSDDFGRECLKIGKEIFALFESCPNRNIFENTSNENFDESDGIIRAQQYISFIADTQGMLYQNIERAVNDEFNECSQIEQPAFLQVYDREIDSPREGLDFEYKIFPLLDDLCTLLNQIP